MRQSEIEFFKKSKHVNYEKIESFKLANIGKIIKNRMVDFSHSFYGKINLL
jgi:hypothetical protein